MRLMALRGALSNGDEGRQILLSSCHGLAKFFECEKKRGKAGEA